MLSRAARTGERPSSQWNFELPWKSIFIYSRFNGGVQMTPRRPDEQLLTLILLFHLYKQFQALPIAIPSYRRQTVTSISSSFQVSLLHGPLRRPENQDNQHFGHFPFRTPTRHLQW